MSENNEAIASLRSSVDVLHAMLVGLQAQASDLTSRLAAIELGFTASKALEDAARALTERRFGDLQNQISLLTAKHPS